MNRFNLHFGGRIFRTCWDQTGKVGRREGLGCIEFLVEHLLKGDTLPVEIGFVVTTLVFFYQIVDTYETMEGGAFRQRLDTRSGTQRVTHARE